MELLNRLNYRQGKTAKGIAIGLLGIVFAAIGILPTEQRQRVDKCWANNVTHNYWNDTVTFNCSYGTGAYRPIKNAIIYNRYSHVSK